MADASVVIDTQLNTDGISKGVKEASSKMMRLNNSIKQTQAELSRVTARMKDLENTDVPTKEYSDLENALKRAEARFDFLVKKRDELANSGHDIGTREWEVLNRQVENACLTMDTYRAKLAEVQTKSVAGTSTAEYAQLEATYSRLSGKLSVQSAQHSELALREATAAAKAQELATSEDNVASKSDKVAEGINRINSASKKGFGSLFKGSLNATKGVQSLSSKIKEFRKRIASVLKSVFIFTVLTKAFTALKDKMGQAVAQNAQLSSSLGQVKGNLNTAFQSIFSAALPALTALFNTLAKVTAAIASFTSAIFGKSVKASQAAAKAADKQAASVGGVGNAAKKASKQLMSFDDAQILKKDDDSSSSGGGGSSASITPEYGDIDTSWGDKWAQQVKDAWANADFTDIGMTVGEKLNSALASIPWDNIKSTATNIASSIATFLNGAIAGTDWNLVGGTLAEILNTKFAFLCTLVTTFNWSSLGTALANTINGFIQRTDFKQIAQTISGALNGLLSTIISLLADTDWAQIGRSVVQLIVNIDWAQMLVQLGDALIGLVVGAFELLFGIAGELCSSIGDFFESIGCDGIAGFFKGIADNLATAAAWIKDKFNTYIVQPVKDFFGIHSPSTLFADFGNMLIEGLKNGITSTIKAIPKIFINIFTTAWNGIKNIFSLSNITSHFSSVINKIKSLFSNVGGAIASAVGKTFASGVNGVFSTIESIVNGFINKINSVIGAINKIPGVKLKKISTVSLPRLATGTVVPANYGEFAAILGDNKRETEVVSPLSTIRQAVTEAMKATDSDKNITLVVNLDGQQIYKSVVKYNNRNTYVTGKNALAY